MLELGETQQWSHAGLSWPLDDDLELGMDGTTTARLDCGGAHGTHGGGGDRTRDAGGRGADDRGGGVMGRVAVGCTGVNGGGSHAGTRSRPMMSEESLACRLSDDEHGHNELGSLGKGCPVVDRSVGVQCEIVELMTAGVQTNTCGHLVRGSGPAAWCGAWSGER